MDNWLRESVDHTNYYKFVHDPSKDFPRDSEALITQEHTIFNLSLFVIGSDSESICNK